MVTCISHSPEDTLRLGEEWGREAQPGWVVGLRGELGSGKTQLVKGLARGLQISVRVHSPTFALINQYEGGRLPLHHLDLYRLNGPVEVYQAGLEEYFWNPSGVTVIEWVERCLETGPLQAESLLRSSGGFRYVRIETLDECDRRFEYEDFSS